jgi:hypothetical protein
MDVGVLDILDQDHTSMSRASSYIVAVLVLGCGSTLTSAAETHVNGVSPTPQRASGFAFMSSAARQPSISSFVSPAALQHSSLAALSPAARPSSASNVASPAARKASRVVAGSPAARPPKAGPTVPAR